MLIRAIALSIALLVGIGTIVPLATEYAEAGPRKQKYKKKRSWKGVKKYSKKWWALYRAQERRKKSLASRKRSLRLRQIRLENARNSGKTDDAQPTAVLTKSSNDSEQAVLPSGEKAPKSWKKGQATAGELQFRVDDNSGAQIGSASISVVGPAMNQEAASRNKTLGGVPQASLRRTVIDRMIRENGWVVNDFQKEIGGKKVYVVVAQSQSGASVQSRMFYFTEVDGRIYSVATNAPSNAAERLAEESEKVINSLQRRVSPVQQAELR